MDETKRNATKESIREMIIESSGISFEKNISINQDLTFTYANKTFKKENIAQRKLKFVKNTTQNIKSVLQYFEI